MRYEINGLTDIYTILCNERKVGGVVEAEMIRLRSGEEYTNPVITSLDTDGTTIYSVGFVTEDGKRYIVHINDISMISQPVHKNVCQLCNETYKTVKTAEKLKYLKRLCEVNEGSTTPVFMKEVEQIVADIGTEAASVAEFNLPVVLEKRKIGRVRIA